MRIGDFSFNSGRAEKQPFGAFVVVVGKIEVGLRCDSIPVLVRVLHTCTGTHFFIDHREVRKHFLLSAVVFKMTLNLNKHGAAMQAAWKAVLSPDDPTDWALFGYDGNTFDLKLVSKVR